MATLDSHNLSCILIVAYTCAASDSGAMVRLLIYLLKCMILFEYEHCPQREANLCYLHGYTCVSQDTMHFYGTIHTLHQELEIDVLRRFTFLDLEIHLLYVEVTRFSKWILHFECSIILDSSTQGSDGA
jgi:hypothetical protein